MNLGIHCETNIDDCVGYPCQNYGTCVDLVDRFFCDCPPGFGGDICEIAINECENNPCENKEWNFVKFKTFVVSNYKVFPIFILYYEDLFKHKNIHINDVV